MNEIEAVNSFQPQNFDYDQLDVQTAVFLKQRVSNMEHIAGDTRYRMGRELCKAQEKLANHYQGVFVKWYESLGLKKDNVYFWINEYKFSRNLESLQQATNFGALPKTLKQDVMKKSAPEEAKQAVLNGDIKTHKEYKALIEKLNAKERELADAKKTIADQEEQLDVSREREAEKTVCKINDEIRSFLKDMELMIDGCKAIENVSEANIDNLNSQLSSMQSFINDMHRLTSRQIAMKKETERFKQGAPLNDGEITMLKTNVSQKSVRLVYTIFFKRFNDASYGGSEFFSAKYVQIVRLIHALIKRKFGETKYTSIQHSQFQYVMNFVNQITVDKLPESATRLTDKQVEKLNEWEERHGLSLTPKED